MMAMKKLIVYCILFLGLIPAVAQTGNAEPGTVVLGKEIQPKDTTKQRRFKNHLIAPKGGWQCGLSVMYTDFSSSNSDYMMLLQGLNAKASLLRLAPEAAYTFMDNRAVGARFQYTNINGIVDAATADLLGNLSITLENVQAHSKSMSGSVFQRTYIGLDPKGRIGLFWDYILGYTWTKTQFQTGGASSSYTLNKKMHVGFAPGIVYFPMNNISIQACICVADLSYNDVSAFDSGAKVGNRKAWKAQAKLNILDLNFGLTIHL